MADFRTPISFYGKVIDQFGDPVPNVTVTASANDNPFGGKGTNRVLQSDASGFFAIEGMHGLALSIEVSKPGYYRVKPLPGKPGSYGGGLYVTYGKEVTYHPDKNRPTIFTLHKQGVIEPLREIQSARINLPSGGVEVKLGTPYKFIVRAWSHENERAQDGTYDWRCEIEAVKGELVLREEEFDFTAPESGYQKVAIIDMPSSLGRSTWNDTIQRSFFVRFDDGEYGRIEVDIAAPPHGSVSIGGYYNPKIGSRNLESDPNKDHFP